MLVWDEDAQDWIDEPDSTTSPDSTTGLEIPNWSNTGDFSNFKLSDITKFFSGKSPYGSAGQLIGYGGVAALLNKMMGGGGSSGYSGYQGGIPTLTASRQMLPIPTTMQNASGQTLARRPGSGGVSYFSPMQYSSAPVANAVQNTIPAPDTTPVSNTVVEERAGGGMLYGSGGITNLGGYSDGGQLLRGPGDGVSDSIPAMIGKKQPARLADGEFVVPARIVSELGNGSTEAGARKLYAMMDRIKKTRAKAKNIAANTKADKHLPA
jgi:hypothetical protein